MNINKITDKLTTLLIDTTDDIHNSLTSSRDKKLLINQTEDLKKVINILDNLDTNRINFNIDNENICRKI
jgi:hypothetical protein